MLHEGKGIKKMLHVANSIRWKTKLFSQLEINRLKFLREVAIAVSVTTTDQETDFKEYWA